MNETCPTADGLAELLDGRLQPTRAEALRRHIDTCVDCQVVIARMVERNEDVPTPEAEAAGPGGVTLLGRSAFAGRYRVDAWVGDGGMATVYAAFDVKLERPIALKVMVAEGDHGSQIAQRLERESRAMARLRHRNVVTVYDTGAVDGLL